MARLVLTERGVAAVGAAVLLPLYASVLMVIVRRRGWDLWHAFTLGNAALGILAAAVATLLGAWPGVLGQTAATALPLGLLTGAALALPIIVVVWLPGRLGESLGQAGVGGVAAGRLAYRVVVQVLICTVVFEEVAFRGVLYALLAGVSGTAVGLAVAGTAASFGVWHTALLADMFAGWRGWRRLGLIAVGLLAYGLLGLVLALLRAVTGTLLSALAAHGALDLLMIGGMALHARAGRQGQPSFAATPETDRGRRGPLAASDGSSHAKER